MKVCPNCNVSFPDDVMFCSKCGNQNLTYQPEPQPVMPPVAPPVPPMGQPVGQPVPQQAYKPKPQVNIKIADFFKGFFKSPADARDMLIESKDFITPIIFMGISFVLYLVYGLCLQGGLAIRYDLPFDGLFGILYPILFFIVFAGVQFVDVFLYSVYSDSQLKRKSKPALPVLIYCSTHRLFPIAFVFIASIFALFSPVISVVLLIAAIVITIITNISAKLKFGKEPQTLVDSIIFAATGIISTIIAIGIPALLIYAHAESYAEKVVYGLMSSSLGSLSSFF